MKKHLKRALSMLLALVLVVTTFFIFDPSLLRVESDAYVNVETAQTSAYLASQKFYATETIYTKPGSSAFQYYENYSYTSGTVSSPVDTSGSIYFRNDDAEAIKFLGVNNYYRYEKSGSTVTRQQMPTGTLTINSTTINEYAGMAVENATHTKGTALVSGKTGGEVEYNITAGSATGLTEGETYVIEWVIVYTIGGVDHYAYAYTGIYVQPLTQAGITYAARHSDGDATLHGYSFITGIHKVGGGNAKSKLVNTVHTGPGSLAAPLVAFIGYVNNSSNYTFIGGNSDYMVGGNLFASQAQGGVACQTQGVINMDGGDSVQKDAYFVTKTATNATGVASSPGTYENPATSGTIYREQENAADHTTGVGYILVDKSRYTNYNQIPYLSVGWAQLYAYDATENAKLNWIVCMDHEQTEYYRGQAVSLNGFSVNIGNTEIDGKELNSWTRGLFKINGPIPSQSNFMQIVYCAHVDRNRTLNDHKIQTYSNTALSTTIVNHNMLRQQYNKALCSYVDYHNIQTYASSMSYTNYYNYVRQAGEELADPTAHSMENLTALETFVNDCVKTVSQQSAPEIYFYVPEVIYVNPAADSNGHYNFKYYVDRQSTINGALTKDAKDTLGDIFFTGTNAVELLNIEAKLLTQYSSDNQQLSVTLGGTNSSTGTIATTISSGYITVYETAYIEWTATYKNRAGQELKATAYSACYGIPLYNQSQNCVISATARARDKRNTSDYYVMTITSWIMGTHTVDYNGYVPSTGVGSTTVTTANKKKQSPATGISWNRSGSYNTSLFATTAPIAGSNTNAESDAGRSGFDSLYSSGIGGSATFGDPDSSSYNDTGGYGTILIDSSRYTALNQIPYLTFGVDCNFYAKENSFNANRTRLYYDWWNGSNVRTTANEAIDYVNEIQAGTRKIGDLSKATFSTTDTSKLLVLRGENYFTRGSDRYASGSCYLQCNFRNKGPLREAYENTVKKTQYLQEEYFTETEWAAFIGDYHYLLGRLFYPQAGETQAQMNEAARVVNNRVNRMVAAVTATTDKFSYEITNADGTKSTVSNVDRASVIRKGEVKVYHYALVDEGQLLEISPVETESYYLGETINTGYNEIPGYTYFGYYRSTGTDTWDVTKFSDLQGDTAQQGAYGDTGHNTDQFYNGTTLTYTYVYTPIRAAVYLDGGEADTAFENMPNLANVQGATADWCYEGDGTYNGNAEGELTANGFDFSVKAGGVGYNIETPIKGADFTNLVSFSDIDTSQCGGGTLTVDSDKKTITNVTGAGQNDGYVGNAYGAFVLKLTPGNTYRFVFDYQINTENLTSLQYYLFNCADMNKTGANSAAYPQIKHEYWTPDEHADTFFYDFTVPSNMPGYVSFRFGTSQENSNVTFGDIGVYDITDTTKFAKMNDFFLENVATGLEGGNTYTISFESSLQYDEYYYWAMDMYGNPSPERDWLHNYGSIQMFISTTKGNDELYNYTVPIGLTTDISSGGTIGTFDLPGGCTNINLGFCVTSDQPLTGWVDNIRIVKGDYVEEGRNGQTVTLPEPYWEGYSFSSWTEGRQPFYGEIEAPKTYTYGVDGDTVLADWTINKYDVTFDNEFDFDKYVWSGSGRSDVLVDTENNIVTIANSVPRTNGSYDSYAGAYSSAQTGRMILEPGHTYKLSYDFKNLDYATNSSLSLYPYVFDSANGSSYAVLTSKQTSFTAETGTHSLTFTVKEGKPYITIRMGTASAQDVEFSDIYIQDITRGRTVADNEFDFSSWNWSVSSAATNFSYDATEKSVTFTPNGDAYTSGYSGNNANLMLLEEGHTYSFSYKVTNMTPDSYATIFSNPFIFCFPTSSATWSECTFWNWGKIVSETEKNLSFEFTVPEGKPYVSMRFSSNTNGATVKFSGLVIKNVTTGSVLVDDTTVSEPQLTFTDDGSEVTAAIHGVVRTYKEVLCNENDLPSLPIMTSELFDFSGWYTEKYGTGTRVETTTQTVAGTNQHFSHWTVHLDYAIGGGAAYKNPSKAPQAQTGLKMGSTVTVGSYVPFKDGYNFKGWQYTEFTGSTSTTKTVLPGATVTLNHNVNLSPVWEEATAVNKDTDYTECSTLYPGQVYFYKYTPTKNEYVSGYIYDGASNITLDVYSNNAVVSAGSTAYNYGVTNLNSLASYGVNANTTCYYGISSGSDSIVTSSAKFRITEHTIKYTLDPNGGTVTNTSATGYYNTDTALETPVRTGYTFTGWQYSTYLFDAGKVPAASNTQIIKNNKTSFVTNATLIANWSINSYKLTAYAYYNRADGVSSSTNTYTHGTTGGTVSVTYNGSTSSGATAQKNVTYNEAVTYFATPATGYAFAGWYQSPTISGGVITDWGSMSRAEASVEIPTMAAADLTVYAKFDIASYDVTLYAFSDTNTAVGSYENSVTGGTVGFTEDAGQLNVTGSYVYGQKYTMYAEAKAGYAFEGWYYNNNALTGTASYNQPTVEITVTGAHSYKAKFSIQKFILQLNPNGGTLAGESSYTNYMGSTQQIANPTYPGYTFEGWKLAAHAGGNAYGSFTGTTYTFGAGNDLATAKWSLNNYAITVDPNGGTAAINYWESSQQVDVAPTLKQVEGITTATAFNMAYNQDLSLYVPTKTGYSFDEWVVTNGTGSFTPGATGQASIYKVGVDDTAVITATWNVNQYTLNVQAWGNTVSAEDAYSQFTGGTVKIGEDGEASRNATKQIDFNSTAMLYAEPATGYHFVGWQTKSPSTADELNILSSAIPYETAAMTTSGLIYYAIFDLNEHTVNISAAFSSADAPDTYTQGTTGGTVGFQNGTMGETAGETFSYGTPIVITAQNKTGYKFLGWFESLDATSALYTETAHSMNVTEDTSLVAKFQIQQYGITTSVQSNTASNLESYTDNQYAGTVTGAGLYYYGETTDITASANVGYEFAGWYSDYSLSTLVTADPHLAVTVEGGRQYYAKFNVLAGNVQAFAMSNSSTALTTYTNNSIGGTVSFASDSGYAETASHNPYYYGVYDVYAKPATGYAFNGWYKDAALSTEAVDEVVSSEYVEGGGYYHYQYTFKDFTNGEVLYAKFSVGMYKLEAYAMSNTGDNLTHFANNTTGGTVSIEGQYINGVDNTQGLYASANVYYGESASLIATAATGYNFAGWYVDKDLTNALGGNESAAMGVSGLKYYAKFVVGQFTIEYNANGGSSGSVASQTAYYNTMFNIDPNAAPASRTGYIFKGWSLDNTATEATYMSGASIPAETISSWYVDSGTTTLYAVWVESSFTINLASAYGASGTYYISDLGGTVKLKDEAGGKIPVGAVVQEYLEFTPATGYALTMWRYSETAAIPSGSLSSINVWGKEGTGQYTMPEGSVNVVAYFDISSYDADVWAYHNTAADESTYINSAAGGTVRLNTNGTAGSTAKSNTEIYGQPVKFMATAAKGYNFDGWYGYDFDKTPVDGDFLSDKKLVCETEIANFVMGDDVNGDPRTNHYFAVFSILSWNATVSSRTFNVREDLIYSLEEGQFPGGVPSIAGANKVGVGLDNDTTDSSWLWLEETVNEKTIEAAYGVRVYFYAEAATGYNFAGWYNEKDAEYYGEALVEEFNNAYSRIMRESDFYLEAKFIPVSFTLKYDANGGVAGNPEEIIVTYNSPFKIATSSAPTYIGKNFMGWADSQAGTVNEAYSVTITPEVIAQWYSSLVDNTYTLYAIWETAKITITLDKQGSDESNETIEVEVGTPLPDVAVPEYEGFIFRGYYAQSGGEGVLYYDKQGAPTGQLWNQNTDGVLYAFWQCPVLTDIDYNKESGQWTYTYQDDAGGLTSVETENPATTAGDITEMVETEDSLVWWKLTIDKLDTGFVEERLEEAENINLNHYSQAALSDLLNAVTLTDTDDEREKLTQPQANAYVARMAKDMDTDYSDNVRPETNKPSISIYENEANLVTIKSETITDPEDSATGNVYPTPASADASSYVYANKHSYTADGAVDYFIYTNSPNPVIALELNDGEVAETVAGNTSSYPTKATISDNSSSASYIDTDKATYMTSAVKATDDIQKAWFSNYTRAGIGTSYDYNAKTVIYLTPEFTASGVQNEIVYTITPSDDAAVSNEGVSATELSTESEADRLYSSYNYTVEKDSITVCICYHNSMNGDSDEGTVDASGNYMQMYMDQVDIDTYLNQLHLFRTSGGASNWEFPKTDDTVYPVDDPTYPFDNVRCTLGSFAYVFDASIEPTATAYAESGNYAQAKSAIIASISDKASVAKAAISSRSNELNINTSGTGLGYFEIAGWSTNFYPKSESYVYAHLVDRWGNVYNRVWKCFNVDSYPSTISETDGASTYSIFEDGGSNIDTVTLDGAEVSFVLDSASTFENGVFTTTGNTITLSTGEPNKTYNITVTDKATNVSTAQVTTDDNGNLVLDVEDAKADLSSGAYTFTLNGATVNLYAGVDPLVYDAEISSVALYGEETTVTVKTSARASKVQLEVAGSTRTYTRLNATVVENEDGTLTWTIKTKLGLGDHEIGLCAKGQAGWEDTDYVLSTKVIKEEIHLENALKSVYDDEVMTDERANIKLRVIEGTEKVQLVNATGETRTYNRDAKYVQSVVDGVETWLLPAFIYSDAGEYEVQVIAKLGNGWQTDSSKSATVTVKDPAAESVAEIYSVEASQDVVERGDYVTFTVLTNGKTTKLRFNYSLTTATYSDANATVVENLDGTKLWTVKTKFHSLGENDINFSAKSSGGWTEGESFGSVEVVAD